MTFEKKEAPQLTLSYDGDEIVRVFAYGITRHVPMPLIPERMIDDMQSSLVSFRQQRSIYKEVQRNGFSVCMHECFMDTKGISRIRIPIDVVLEARVPTPLKNQMRVRGFDVHQPGCIRELGISTAKLQPPSIDDLDLEDLDEFTASKENSKVFTTCVSMPLYVYFPEVKWKPGMSMRCILGEREGHALSDEAGRIIDVKVTLSCVFQVEARAEKRGVEKLTELCMVDSDRAREIMPLPLRQKT